MRLRLHRGTVTRVFHRQSLIGRVFYSVDLYW